MGQRYLFTVDYYSLWVEIKLLTTQTTKSVITAAKEPFASHGILDIVILDNGPCLSAVPTQEFAAKYGFVCTTSSPRYPPANVDVEKGCKDCKGVVKEEQGSLPCTSHLQICAPANWSHT